GFDFIGGRTRTRTWDPLIKSQLLYQLSYAPETPAAVSPARAASCSKASSHCPARPCGRVLRDSASARPREGHPATLASRGRRCWDPAHSASKTRVNALMGPGFPLSRE